MLEYTKTEPSMEIRAAGGNILHGTAQGVLVVVICGTDGVLRKVKLTLVLVPSLKKSLFSSSAAAKKSVKTVIAKTGSSLDLGPFRVQLTRLDDMDHLDLTKAKESRGTESALCAIPGKPFDKESVLTALVPNKSVALLVNIDQRVVENASVEDQNNDSTYKVYDNTNEKVRFCEKVEHNAPSSMTEGNDGKYESLEVSSCQQVENDAPSSTIDDTEGNSKSSGVSSSEQKQPLTRIRLQIADPSVDRCNQWDTRMVFRICIVGYVFGVPVSLLLRAPSMICYFCPQPKCSTKPTLLHVNPVNAPASRASPLR